MAIVVEDGTGLSNAQCYESVANLDAYLAERGLTTSATDAEKEAALVVAAKDWIDGRHTFANSKLVSTQALQFPRNNDVGLPDDIKVANIKAAWLQLQGLLLVDLSTISTSGTVESESKAVGSLSKSTTYKDGSAQVYARVIPEDLNILLRPYLLASGGMGRTYRVL
jgi:hypothetical protein